MQRAASCRQACETCRRTVPRPASATPRERAPRRTGMRNDIAKVAAAVKNKGGTSPRQLPLSSPTLCRHPRVGGDPDLEQSEKRRCGSRPLPSAPSVVMDPRLRGDDGGAMGMAGRAQVRGRGRLFRIRKGDKPSPLPFAYTGDWKCGSRLAFTGWSSSLTARPFLPLPFRARSTIAPASRSLRPGAERTVWLAT